MHHQVYISASQIRAARALLNRSQEDLAATAGLSINTIRKLEFGHISPRGKTTEFIRNAFENSGLEFIESNGVRQKPETIEVFEGSESLINFFDDIYHTTRRKGGDIITVATNPSLTWKMLGEFGDVHRNRMHAIRNTFTCRCLVTENTKDLPAPSYCEYHTLSKSYVNSISFYVYDDKCAIRAMSSDNYPRIVIVSSRSVADSFRQQFNSMWDKATPLNEVTYDKQEKRKK